MLQGTLQQVVVSGSPLCALGTSHPRQVGDHLQENPQGNALTSRPARIPQFKALSGATDALSGLIAISESPRLQPGFGITFQLTT